MNAVSYTDVRKNLKFYMDKAYEEHDPVIVTRKNSENVIILSLTDYDALIETRYLLSNEHNSKKILSSLKDSRNRKLLKKKMIEA